MPSELISSQIPTKRSWFTIVLRGFLALFWRETRRFFRIWSQSFVPPVVTTSLYFLVFGSIIGSKLAPISGVSFMAYIIPGLALMGAINNAYTNIASSFFSAKFSNSIEELLISPIPLWSIYLAYMSASVLRAFIVVVLILISSLFFTHGLTIEHPLVAFLTILFTTTSFSALGFLNGLFAKSFDAVSVVPTFIIAPLTYLGGVFYNINQLPPFFMVISHFNPIYYMVEAFRYSFYGIGVHSIFTLLSALFFMSFVLTTFVLWMLSKGYGIRK